MIKKSNHINKIILIFFAIVLLINIISNVQAIETHGTIQKFEFIESIEEFNNPDMGIYRPTAIQCQAEGDWPNTRIQYANGLVHLRIGIRDFSKAGNGTQDYDITREHIEKLNGYMRSSKRSRRNCNSKICI